MPNYLRNKFIYPALSKNELEKRTNYILDLLKLANLSNTSLEDEFIKHAFKLTINKGTTIDEKMAKRLGFSEEFSREAKLSFAEEFFTYLEGGKDRKWHKKYLAYHVGLNPIALKILDERIVNLFDRHSCLRPSDSQYKDYVKTFIQSNDEVLSLNTNDEYLSALIDLEIRKICDLAFSEFVADIVKNILSATAKYIMDAGPFAHKMPFQFSFRTKLLESINCLTMYVLNLKSHPNKEKLLEFISRVTFYINANSYSLFHTGKPDYIISQFKVHEYFSGAKESYPLSSKTSKDLENLFRKIGVDSKFYDS